MRGGDSKVGMDKEAEMKVDIINALRRDSAILGERRLVIVA